MACDGRRIRRSIHAVLIWYRSVKPAKVQVGQPKTSARSSTDRASDYGSEGWGFESLRARPGQRPLTRSGRGLSATPGSHAGSHVRMSAAEQRLAHRLSRRGPAFESRSGRRSNSTPSSRTMVSFRLRAALRASLRDGFASLDTAPHSQGFSAGEEDGGRAGSDLFE